MDPIIRLAQQRAIADAFDIEVQLSKQDGTRPILSMLVKARTEAAEALSALAFVDPVKADDIRALQNGVVRYDNMLRWMRELLAEGHMERVALDEVAEQEIIDSLYSGRDSAAQDEAREAGIITGESQDA